MSTIKNESYVAGGSTVTEMVPMPRIKKILFPVDFSDSCYGAARYVEAFAGQFEAEITLLHAVTNGERVLAAEFLPQRKEALDAFLADELKYFTTRRLCVVGDPTAALLDTAASWNPDLVMLPTHGLGYFRRHLLGSVTAKVLHDLKCPVWTSVHAEAAPSLEKIHCHKILCAVDFGSNNLAVLQWASWLAGEYNATLGIVHAASEIGTSVEAWTVAEELQQAVLERTAQQVAALQARAGTAAAEVFIRPGSPATTIAATARSWGADLLVIGRHVSEGLTAQLFQSAYGILTESPCPVVSI
jgi:nucleotide-binding universal stress UspA family protein